VKIAILKTYTTDTDIYWKTLPKLGHGCHQFPYDHLPHSRHGEIVDGVRVLNPDIIIFIGAVEKSHGRPILQSTTLQNLSTIAPMIHMCGDAGDEPWWPILESYDRLGCFCCQVSIDGNFETPLSGFKNGIVKLCPVDPDSFVNCKPWDERSVFVGMTGGIGHGERGEMMRSMMKLPYVKAIRYGSDYQAVADFMGDCKIIVNHSMRGSGQGGHVKARVVETGWAGACLFESNNSHTRKWFSNDYVEYLDVDDIIAKLNHFRNDASLEHLANKFNCTVSKQHHPKVFWHDVFEKAGVGQ
jgi:hypothetical protein